MTTTHLEILDIVILVATVAASCLISFHFTNKSIETDRIQYVIPVAMSMLTSAASGLSLMGYSSELFYQGPSYSMTFISTLLAGPIAAHLILPVLHRSNEFSPYSYLKKRYGSVVKYFVTTLQMMLTIGCNAVAIYLPSMALRSILGIDLYYSILIFGSICVLYSVSGLKAVLWTDIFLIGVVFASLIVVNTFGTYQAGGFEQVYLFVSEGGRIDFDDFLNFDLTTRHTLIGILFGATLKEVYMMGANQAHIQRACNLPSLKHAQVSLVLSSLLTAVLISLATYSGAVIYATFGPCDPYIGDDGPPRRDVILLHYVANYLSFLPGIRGLFVAGIFLVSMTIMNSTTNGMASLILLDYIRPLVSRCTPELGQGTGKLSVFLPRIMTAITGYMCVLAAYAVDSAQSRLLQASVTLSAAIGVPILGAIVLGMLTSFANTAGIMAGFAVNLSLGVYVTFEHVFVKPPLEPTMFVHYEEECESIFNMTSKPQHESTSTKVQFLNESIIVGDLQMLARHFQFDIADISYVTLPLVQFVSMIFIASLVSLLTGGYKQIIPEELMLFHRKQRELIVERPQFANRLKNQIMVASGDNQSDKIGLDTIIGRSFREDSLR